LYGIGKGKTRDATAEGAAYTSAANTSEGFFKGVSADLRIIVQDLRGALVRIRGKYCRLYEAAYTSAANTSEGFLRGLVIGPTLPSLIESNIRGANTSLGVNLFFE
jgi:hypothetical protein